jgi:hypothetical protein
MREVRIALVCTALTLAVTTAAIAQTEPPPAAQDETGMADFFKGSLNITLPAFKKYRVTRQFAADHTYVDLERGKPVPGTWTLENGKICTQRPAAQRYCNTGLGKKIGDTWQDKDPYTGNEVDFALVAGREAPR